MTVVAIQKGFHGQYLRKVGDVFEISDKLNEAGEVIAFSRIWMKKLETEKETPPRAD